MSSKEQYRLIFEGPSDADEEVLRKIKAVFVVELELDVERVQKILSSPPAVVLEASELSLVKPHYGALKKAGAKVSIQRVAAAMTADSDELQETSSDESFEVFTGDQEEILEFELDLEEEGLIVDVGPDEEEYHDPTEDDPELGDEIASLLTQLESSTQVPVQDRPQESDPPEENDSTPGADLPDPLEQTPLVTLSGPIEEATQQDSIESALESLNKPLSSPPDEDALPSQDRWGFNDESDSVEPELPSKADPGMLSINTPSSSLSFDSTEASETPADPAEEKLETEGAASPGHLSAPKDSGLQFKADPVSKPAEEVKSTPATDDSDLDLAPEPEFSLDPEPEAEVAPPPEPEPEEAAASEETEHISMDVEPMHVEVLPPQVETPKLGSIGKQSEQATSQRKPRKAPDPTEEPEGASHEEELDFEDPALQWRKQLAASKRRQALFNLLLGCTLAYLVFETSRMLLDTGSDSARNALESFAERLAQAPAPKATESEESTPSGFKLTELGRVGPLSVRTTFSGTGDKVSAATFRFRAESAPKLSPAEIAREATLPPWIWKIELKNLPIELDGGRFTLEGAAGAFIQDGEQRQRIPVQFSLSGSYDVGSKIVTGQLEIARGEVVNLNPGELIGRNDSDDFVIHLVYPFSARPDQGAEAPGLKDLS